MNHSKATTANGAVSNAHIDPTNEYEGRLQVQYRSIRGISDEDFDSILNKSLSESIVDTGILAFHIRDCRGGKGERKLGRTAICKFINHQILSDISVLEALPKWVVYYGRWDDLVWIWHKSIDTRVRNVIINFIRQSLEKDMIAAKSGNIISLCAKWLPTEGSALDKATKFVAEFTKKISRKEYRKTLSFLRSYIDIVEKRLCSMDFKNIKYENVPSCAMHRLSNVFKKHDRERFNDWIQKVRQGSSKINSGQLFPHQIVSTYKLATSESDLVESQWKEMAKKYTGLGNCLVVVDVSGSMYSGPHGVAPIDVALSMGILYSGIAKSIWKDYIMTFSESPKMHSIKYTSLYEKLKSLCKADWGMNTNLQSVFNLILSLAKQYNLSQNDMPEKLIIISDMQFDRACENNKTNYEVIVENYSKSGYQIPKLIFWNVASSKDSPLVSTDKGVLLSGFSPNILRYVCGELLEEEFTPLGLLKQVLNDKRYEELKKELEK